FEGVHVLPVATTWIFRDVSVERKGTYFQSLEWEDQAPLEPEPYYRELRNIFSRTLPRYFESREPIAMSLTGGLDTRMIMAWHKPLPGSLPCYTFVGMFRECRDAVVARRVARVCKQSHEVIRVADEFLSRFPDYAERSVYLTDGCVDVSRSPDLYVNEKAREIAPVRMTGNYGDEVRLRLIGDGNPALRRIRTDRGFGGGGGHLAAAASRGFFEFWFKAEYAYDYAMPEWLARIDHRLSAFRLERLFLGRHKFYHFRVWYRDVLSEYVREMLLDPRTLSRPYLERKGLEAVVKGHLKGDRNYTIEIHQVLTLELLHRLFVDPR